MLARDDFKQLAGMRLGLVTNHTGRDREGRQTIDVLKNAPNVHLVALFSPEHGIRGLADEKVSDSKDEQTGLPIYSLYGETRRPKSEQLKNLDAIVFDIQDIGARFYTYISTLGYVMEEAAKAKIAVIVLDRPNPINGIDVEGPLADKDKLSFTGIIDSGAAWSDSGRTGAVVQSAATNWLRFTRNQNGRLEREMWFDATNLNWVNPSPNMRSLTEATLYPGVGLLETTNVQWGGELILRSRWSAHRGSKDKSLPHILIDVILRECDSSRALHSKRFCVQRRELQRHQYRHYRSGEVSSSAHRNRNRCSVASPLSNDWKIDSYLRLLVNAATLERVKRGDPRRYRAVVGGQPCRIRARSRYGPLVRLGLANSHHDRGNIRLA